MKHGWLTAGAIGLPIATMTAYLVWIWPLPRGSSLLAQTSPYIVSLLTGLPFAWILARRSGRIPILMAFLGGGFVLLWLYALAILCVVRDTCS
jgi:hypothetical protein